MTNGISLIILKSCDKWINPRVVDKKIPSSVVLISLILWPTKEYDVIGIVKSLKAIFTRPFWRTHFFPCGISIAIISIDKILGDVYCFCRQLI